MEKLTLRADFDAVMAAGVVARTSHFALHQQPQTETSRIGAVVPKRWARKAVTRNLIKRQIYALGREPWTSELPWADRVIRLRKTFDNKLFTSASSDKLRHAIRSELQQLMDPLSVKGVEP